MELILISVLTTVTLMSTVAAFIALKRYKNLQQTLDIKIEQANQEARNAIAAKDTFLANISHETRTPMNAIIGLSHILLQTDLTDEQKKNLFKIKRSAEHLLSITNDILDYSKLEAGKLTLESITIDNADFFNNISDIITPMATDKELDLIFDISPTLPISWEGDPLRISQILLNLLNNAVKFTEKGVIILRAYLKRQHGKDAIRFEVSDTGIGLKEEQLARLFEAFSQADNSISRKFGGTGLGLSISAELAAMMGTKIEVESLFGEGTTFAFTLTMKNPVYPDDKFDRLSLRLLEGKSILIADKNVLNSKILANILSRVKAKPVIAKTVYDVDRLSQWEHYDAALIDSRLLAKINIKQLKEHCDTLIIMPYDLLQSITIKQIEPDAVLHKPFTPLSVQSIMTEVFGKTILEHSIAKKHVSFDDILVLEGSRILMAEDNDGNVMVIEGLLEGSGIILEHAHNGQKAVEMLLKNDQKPFDLILMDINMPVMDGYAATSIIREYQKYDDLPIIAMTANITQSDIEKTKSVGMQDFIGKPVDVERFYTKLLKYIPPKKQKSEVHATQNDPTRQLKHLELSLPGVDTHEGISRVNGNTNAYIKILLKYADLFKNVTVRLSNAITRGARDEGISLAHNLKGLSGNIGAKELYRIASEIESGFKNGDKDIAALIKTLGSKIDPLILAIRKLDNQQPQEQKKTPLSSEELTKILSTLKEQAEKKKALDIKRSCATLKEHQLPATQETLFNDLIDNAEQYRYDEVVKIVDMLLTHNTTKALGHP